MSDLDLIRQLQNTLNELENARARLAGVPDWMQELHDEHSQRKAEIEAEAEAVAEAERLRREAEAAHSDYQEKLKQYQEQIGRVNNQREYGALLKEIDTVKGHIKDSEEKAMSALEASETSKQSKQKLEAEFKDLDGRYSEELGKWEAEKPSVEKEAKRLEDQSESLREKISRPVLSLFDRLHQRTGGQALAEVLRMEVRKGNPMWHCSACSFNVRPQIVVEIQGGGIHHCDSCKRILFSQPAEDNDE